MSPLGDHPDRCRRRLWKSANVQACATGSLSFKAGRRLVTKWWGERMIALDEEYLAGLGLGALSADDKRSLLAVVYRNLEETVGGRVAKLLSDAELEEFNRITDSQDGDEAAKWLKEHVPDYRRIVQEVHDEHSEELRRRRDEILEAVGVEAAVE